jgi:hypothetical protein
VCTNTTHGLPSPFNLQLTAEVKTPGGCIKVDAKTKGISGYGVPTLDVTTLPVASYCGGSTTSLDVKFTVHSPNVPPGSGWSYSTEVTDVDDSVRPTCDPGNCRAFTGDAEGECLPEFPQPCLGISARAQPQDADVCVCVCSCPPLAALPACRELHGELHLHTTS